MPFVCSICGEESTRICARCTKDACNNHICEKCNRCSDCCECEVTLSEHVREPARSVLRAAFAPKHDPQPDPEPEPEPPALPPDPDPFPADEEEPGPVAP
jgi:hypothetical protein